MRRRTEAHLPFIVTLCIQEEEEALRGGRKCDLWSDNRPPFLQRRPPIRPAECRLRPIQVQGRRQVGLEGPAPSMVDAPAIVGKGRRAFLRHEEILHCLAQNCCRTCDTKELHPPYDLDIQFGHTIRTIRFGHTIFKSNSGWYTI